MEHEYTITIFSDKLGTFVEYKSALSTKCDDCIIYGMSSHECNGTYHKCARLNEQVLGIDTTRINGLDNFIPVQIIHFSLFLASRLYAGYYKKEPIDITGEFSDYL